MLERISFFKQRSKRRWLYALMSVVVSLSLIVGTPKAGYANSILERILRGTIQVLPQVIQWSTISDPQEVSLGQQINEQLVNSGKVRILRNAKVNSYLNQLGQKLAANSARPNVTYTFQAVKDDSVNAFATMGGFVYVNTGLMVKAENEAELASVIAHEIGHIAGRHAIRQLREQAIARGLMSATGLDRSTAIQLGVEVAVNLPNSRGDELEADRLGLEDLVRTGYAPIGMINFMKKLERMGNSGAPAILSSHPATSSRIKALEEAIDPQLASRGAGLDNQAYQNRLRSF